MNKTLNKSLLSSHDILDAKNSVQANAVNEVLSDSAINIENPNPPKNIRENQPCNLIF